MGGLSFGQDSDGNWGYKVGGADTVIPFKSGNYENWFKKQTNNIPNGVGYRREIVRANFDYLEYSSEHSNANYSWIHLKNLNPNKKYFVIAYCQIEAASSNPNYMTELRYQINCGEGQFNYIDSNYVWGGKPAITEHGISWDYVSSRSGDTILFTAQGTNHIDIALVLGYVGHVCNVIIFEC